jgi:gelsolin
MSGLIKQKTIAIEDSNIANLGSEMDKKARLDAAQTETAWHGVGKAPGLRVWRIEKFQVVPWPEAEYGKFFSGDSYIVLNTYKKPDVNALFHDVHFWLGQSSTQDEYGTAAYKTVELDDYLGGVPVQHREVQGHETKLFTTYFKRIEFMDGGIDSGFNKVKPTEYRARLLHVKGTKTSILIREVPLTYKSLNSGDVFIYDGGLTMYQWNGSKSNGVERNKAAEYSKAIQNERKGLPKITVFDEGDKDAVPFWEAIGGEGPVKSAEEGGKDEAAKAFEKILFRISDSSGSMKFTQEAAGTVRASHFDSDDVFLFDCGTEIFVWVGNKSTKEERKKGMQYAMDYMQKHNRPMTIPVSRIIEGGENEAFCANLDPELPPPKFGPKPVYKSTIVDRAPQAAKNTRY